MTRLPISKWAKTSAPQPSWFVPIVESGVESYAIRFDDFFTANLAEKNFDISSKDLFLRESVDDRDILSFEQNEPNFTKSELKSTLLKKQYTNLESSQKVIVWTNPRPIMRPGSAISTEEVLEMFDTGCDFYVTKVHFAAVKTHSETGIAPVDGEITISDAFGTQTSIASFGDILLRDFTNISTAMDYYYGYFDTGFVFRGSFNDASEGGYYITHFGSASDANLTGRIGFEGQYIKSFDSFLTGGE